MLVEGTLLSVYVSSDNQSDIQITGGCPTPTVAIAVSEGQARELVRHVGKDVRISWADGRMTEVKVGDELRLQLTSTF
jgi:hypothetical protein